MSRSLRAANLLAWAAAAIGWNLAGGLLPLPQRAMTKLSLVATARADDSPAPADPGVKALADALKDPDPDVRKNAALSLGRIGPKAESAVPALIAALKDKSIDVRGASAVTLGRIGPGAKDAALPLAALLKDTHPDIRGAAALALARIGKGAKPAIPDLLKVAKGDDPLSAVYARGAGAIGRQTGPAHRGDRRLARR